jgi:drug/metabolite transporter (DMT)-like permease
MGAKILVKENWGYLSLVSLLGVTLFNSMIYYAGHISSAINLSLIAITFPVFVLILSRVFLAERIGWNKLVGIVLVVSGILLLMSKGDLAVLAELTFAKGDVWMLVAALIFAIYSMLLKQKPAGITVPAFQLASFIVVLTFLLPFYLLELYLIPVRSIENSTVMNIVYVGIFSSLLVSYGIKRSLLLVR